MLAEAHLTKAAGAAFSIGINDLLITGAVVCFAGALCATLVRRKGFIQPGPVGPPPKDTPEILAGAAS
jgi:hypothetical protein